MDSPWQYLGHFWRWETSPSASSQPIHTPHICPLPTVSPTTPVKAICLPALCCGQVVQYWCKLIIYSQTQREPVFYILHFCSPLCVKYNAVLLVSITVWQKGWCFVKKQQKGLGCMRVVTFLCWTEPKHKIYQDLFRLYVCFQAGRTWQ